MTKKGYTFNGWAVITKSHEKVEPILGYGWYKNDDDYNSSIESGSPGYYPNEIEISLEQPGYVNIENIMVSSFGNPAITDIYLEQQRLEQNQTYYNLPLRQGRHTLQINITLNSPVRNVTIDIGKLEIYQEKNQETIYTSIPKGSTVDKRLVETWR